MTWKKRHIEEAECVMQTPHTVPIMILNSIHPCSQCFHAKGYFEGQIKQEDLDVRVRRCPASDYTHIILISYQEIHFAHFLFLCF